MSESKLRTQSMDFAVSIINLVKSLKEKRESTVLYTIPPETMCFRGFFLRLTVFLECLF